MSGYVVTDSVARSQPLAEAASHPARFAVGQATSPDDFLLRYLGTLFRGS